jgi:hypothetical protein
MAAGQYPITGPRGGNTGDERTVTKGEPFPPTPKAVGKRKKKVEQFVTLRMGGWVGLSGDLVNCARALLQMALDERRREVLRYPADHFSEYAVGSILLLVTGFDAWLNEVLSEALFVSDRERLKGLADEPLLCRYYGIPHRVAGAQMPANQELSLLVDLRHEIAHYLPRIIPDEGNVPGWLAELRRRQLFFQSDEDDAPLGWRLASYRLAYWAWETVEAAVAEFVSAACVEVEGAAPLGSHCAGNFGIFRTICPPTQLAGSGSV